MNRCYVALGPAEVEYAAPDGLLTAHQTYDVLQEVAEERAHQDVKWGPDIQEHTPLEWLSIEAEEFGEWGEALNKLHFGGWTPERHNALREEMVQTAAVAVCAIEDMDRQLAASQIPPKPPELVNRIVAILDASDLFEEALQSWGCGYGQMSKYAVRDFVDTFSLRLDEKLKQCRS